MAAGGAAARPSAQLRIGLRVERGGCASQYGDSAERDDSDEPYEQRVLDEARGAVVVQVQKHPDSGEHSGSHLYSWNWAGLTSIGRVA